ncbi:hypothetical protein BD410DRAFT_810482, partial [Rickenella mellea]
MRKETASEVERKKDMVMQTTRLPSKRKQDDAPDTTQKTAERRKVVQRLDARRKAAMTAEVNRLAKGIIRARRVHVESRKKALAYRISKNNKRARTVEDRGDGDAVFIEDVEVRVGMPAGANSAMAAGGNTSKRKRENRDDGGEGQLQLTEERVVVQDGATDDPGPSKRKRADRDDADGATDDPGSSKRKRADRDDGGEGQLQLTEERVVVPDGATDDPRPSKGKRAELNTAWVKFTGVAGAITNAVTGTVSNVIFGNSENEAHPIEGDTVMVEKNPKVILQPLHRSVKEIPQGLLASIHAPTSDSTITHRHQTSSTTMDCEGPTLSTSKGKAADTLTRQESHKGVIDMIEKPSRRPAGTLASIHAPNTVVT